MAEATTRPGKGTYKCKNCGTEVTLDDQGDQLPPCPSCGNKYFDEV
ncbi:zinc ribbon-containing protein [Pseudalkalibacillus caeni]|uniref:Rubredoxin-like protein n=1 Tax=Exobacillus caeni TaxID=2574798 RepID=A0A5R9F2B5_9BACL|nr:hypothetical protein [Pseudalkalibacillus caeni]TLS36669.1 hypothetical protein FCL54_14205 [Pseudalkalibacillus caeni]